MIERKTIFSPNRFYRYTLWRDWVSESLPGFSDLKRRDEFVQFIGLNPSTADENQDDNTIRRCIDFAKSWGFGAMCMTNLFAYRTPNPEVMLNAAEGGQDIIGPDNDHWINKVAKEAGLILCAWGNDGTQGGNRYRTILKNALDWQKHLYCLGQTQWNQPKHPLYLKGDLNPQIYQTNL